MKKIHVALVFALVLAVAIPTAAVTVLDTESEDQISDEIIAEPSDGPNGAYALINPETETLEIDLTANNTEVDGSGVSAQALTGIDDVFTLNYTGDEFAEVWLEHDSDNVTFFHEGGESIEGQENNVTLEQDDVVHIGFEVDTRDLESVDPVIDSIEINAQVPEEDDDDDPPVVPGPPAPPDDPPPDDPPPIEVGVEPGERAVTVTDIAPGEPVAIGLEDLEIGDGVTHAEVDIETDAEADLEFDLRRDEAAADPETEVFGEELPASAIGGFEIDPDEGEDAIDTAVHTLEVERTVLEKQEADEDALTLYRQADDADPEDTGPEAWEPVETTVVDTTDETVTLEAIADGFSRYALGVDEAVFTVEELTADPETVTVGEATTLEVTVRNTGEEAGTFQADVLVDDEVLETIETDLEPDETETLDLEYVPEADGDRVITVEDAETVVSVDPVDDVDDDPVDDDPVDEEVADEEVGAFGLAQVLLVLVVLALAGAALWAARNPDELPEQLRFDR